MAKKKKIAKKIKLKTGKRKTSITRKKAKAAVKKTAKKKTAKKLSKAEKKLRKQYRNIYQRAYYRKKKLKKLDPLKKGYKTQRAILYKEIVELNQALLKTGKELGRSTAELFVRPRKKPTKLDTKEKTRTYSAKVWEFEGQLKDYLVDKKFKTIEFPQINKTFNVNKHKPSTILNAYDEVRNLAYTKMFSGTPIVEVVENYATSTITIVVIS